MSLTFKGCLPPAVSLTYCSELNIFNYTKQAIHICESENENNKLNTRYLDHKVSTAEKAWLGLGVTYYKCPIGSDYLSPVNKCI